MASSSNTQIENIDVSDYDDRYTIRRKWAYTLSKPFDTLVEINGEYLNLEDKNGYYNSYFSLHPNNSFSQMYDELTETYDHIFILDIIMSYVMYLDIDKIENWDSILTEFALVDTKRKYESETTFINMYNTWKLKRDKKVENNDALYNIIKLIHTDLDKVKESFTLEDIENKFISSNFVPTNVSIIINPLGQDGEKITFTDGINVFNGCVASKRVPYIKYNDSERSYYKIFAGDSLVDTPNYDNISIPEDESNLENMIYLKMWVEDTGFLCKAGKKDFIKVTYNLRFNKISFTLPEVLKNIKEEDAINYLKLTFSNIVLEKVQRVDIKGKFNIFSYEKEENNTTIFDLNFDEYSILDAITSGLDLAMIPDDTNRLFIDNPESYLYLLGMYLYLDEVEKPFADKIALKLHFRSLTSDIGLGDYLLKDMTLQTISNVSFEIVKNTTISDEDFYIEDTESIIEIPSETEYIQVNVSSKNESDLALFTKLIKILLYAYSKNKDPIEEDYIDILGGQTVDDLNSFQKKYEQSDTIGKEDTKSRKLKKLANDIFVSEYPKICPRPPISISSDQIEYWKKQYVNEVEKNDKGKTVIAKKERQIMSFPKVNPKFHFVCDDNSAPYIGLVRNTLINKDEYPGLPCCYQTDHQIPTKATEYNKVYRDMKMDVRGSKSKGMIKGKFILLPNQYGELPTKINEVLNLYSKSTVKFHRYGVVRSTSSFIHCLSKATSDKRYLELENIKDDLEREDALEKHVRSIRESLIESVNVLKQEIYDRSDEQIREAIWDDTIFLDPALFYRGIEELYNVNIYVFIPESDSSDDGDIETPRNWLFHVISYKPERPTVLIYKHNGSARDVSLYPQCELIVQSYSDGHKSVFDKNMYDICYNIIIEQIKTLTWMTEPNGNINGNYDIYSGINYNKMIGDSAYKQYIDKYGKCRALNFQVSLEEKVYDMTIITPPSQPLDLPLIENPNDISHVHYTIATMIFGEFTKIDVWDGNVYGLWFKIFDIDEGIYVPIQQISLEEFDKDYIQGESNPIFGYQEDKAARYSKLKKNITIIIELIKWIYEIYKREYNNNLGDVDDFFQNYISHDNYIGDSSKYYDLSKVKYKLPSYDKTDDAIDYVSQYTTNMIKDNRIIAYNVEFYNQLYEYLIRYNNYTEGLEGNPSRYISDYFQSVEDFDTTDYTLVFIGSKGYRQWLERNSYGLFNIFNVNDVVSLDKSKLSIPYILREKQKYYLIQNVKKGLYHNALSVALSWLKNNNNIGYDAVYNDREDYSDIGIIIYGVTIRKTLTQLSKYNEDMTNMLEILQYGEQPTARYAAMLPLN